MTEKILSGQEADNSEQMTLKDGSSVTYKYNQDGLRTYKDTKESVTNYQWDDSKLIRETVAYKADGKKYDIWYFYDNDDEAIGFEYSEVDTTNNNNIVKTPIYFEKNKQGDVIGLLDTKGKRNCEVFIRCMGKYC